MREDTVHRDFPGMKEYALLGETLLIFSVLVFPSDEGAL